MQHPLEVSLRSQVMKSKQAQLPASFIRLQLKEIIQDWLLGLIYSQEQFRSLIFYGGTALRKLYKLDRLSEDLDFESTALVDLAKLDSFFKKEFQAQKLSDLVETKTQVGKNIKRLTFKFRVLHRLGLSPLESEKLHLKLEIHDQVKFDHATQLTPYATEFMPVMLNHYTLSVMMASKMRALLHRQFQVGKQRVVVKGRDFYDLVWYLSKGVVPDERFLLTEMGLKLVEVWQQLDQKVKQIRPADLLLDLEPMFANATYIRLWCQQATSLYRRYREGKEFNSSKGSILPKLS